MKWIVLLFFILCFLMWACVYDHKKNIDFNDFSSALMLCIFLQFCAEPIPSVPVVAFIPALSSQDSSQKQAIEPKKDWYNRPFDSIHSIKTAKEALDTLRKIALNTEIHSYLIQEQTRQPLSFSEEVQKAYEYNPNKTLEYICIILLEAELYTECGFYVDASASNINIRQAYRQHKMDSLQLDSLMRRHHYFAYYLCLHTFKQGLMKYMTHESHLVGDWLVRETVKKNAYLRKSPYIRKYLKKLKVKEKKCKQLYEANEAAERKARAKQRKF